MSIPKALLDEITVGNVILFLGAGASVGAQHPQGKPIPTGKQLANALVKEYLGSEYSGISLIKAAEFSIAQVHSLYTVQDFIASLFSDFSPAAFHKLIPTFIWKSIVTINYDLIIERAYDQQDRLQNISPFLKNSQNIEEKLKIPNTIPYIKLHGCISATRDEQIPLILTTEQYLTHRKYRNHLFERFTQAATHYPVIYVGTNLEDFDIRAIWQDLMIDKEVLPRSYIISPNMSPAEKTFWESTYPFLSYIDMSFKDFLSEIDSNINKEFRGLATIREPYQHPICKHFTSGEQTVKENVQLLLSRDALYINQELKPTSLQPQQFYKGYYNDFSPVINNYDIRRTITDNIISEIFLTEEAKGNKEEFYLIKGHAGSGKTILLQRIAWDAATMLDKICLWLDTILLPEYNALIDLYKLCNERIYVIADPIHKYQETIDSWLTKARGDKLPLTIIGAERNSEWNITCRDLHPYVTEQYELKYLNDHEIELILKKLAEYKSLGYLESLPFDKQKEALVQRAHSQLLVALYEVTFGKPFEDILYDEYKSITSPQAQSLYLTVCMLHRLSIPARAGLISRVHNIPFSEFQSRFFKPLDYIVFPFKDKITGDYAYRSRHPVVAETVFERALINEQDRFDEYMRILNSVDVGYSTDKEAFVRLTNARDLNQLFNDPQNVRKLYKTAADRIGEDPLLMQQEAIFEMNSTGGSLDKAGKLLNRAHELLPNNRLIQHSLAEWFLKKADRAQTELEKNQYRHNSRTLSNELTRDGHNSPYPHHTLIKIGIDEFTEMLGKADDVTIERKVADIERTIAIAKQTFPDDGFILSEEAKFCELIDKHPEALTILDRAFSVNKGSTYVAIRLAKLYEKNLKPEKAIATLTDCVDARPSDRFANYNLAVLLLEYNPTNILDIKLHLRRSFTDGDANYIAQFWYARTLYLNNEFEDAKRYFDKLGKAQIDPKVKNYIRGVITQDGKPTIFHGVISGKEYSYGFIKRDGPQDSIFIYGADIDASIWESLALGNRVNFELGFSYKGPKARNVTKETS
jgi:cold shock CspA family protein